MRTAAGLVWDGGLDNNWNGVVTAVVVGSAGQEMGLTDGEVVRCWGKRVVVGEVAPENTWQVDSKKKAAIVGLICVDRRPIG